MSIHRLERGLLGWYRSNDLSRRIAIVPGIGLLGATALAATVTDPAHLRSARQFAAWLGLMPLNNSSDGKELLGRITKMGDQYLRGFSSPAWPRSYGATSTVPAQPPRA